MSDQLFSINYYIFPLVVFGPLFLWVLFNFGLREIVKIPGQMRRQRQLDSEAAKRFETERDRKRSRGPLGRQRGANTGRLGLFAQTVTYIWFAAVIGYFASSPAYKFMPPDTAMIKLSLSHPGKRKEECRQRSAKELAELPPNMRTLVDCSRERWPVHVELDFDGSTIMAESATPKGLADDGPSVFYRTFRVPSGAHRVVVRLREQGESGFGFEKSQQIDLPPGRVLAIDFRTDKGGFIVK